MSLAPLSPNEQERLASLQSYNILDTMSEREFDELTELASVICGTSVSLISLVDKDRQWFKSRFGVQATETPIEQSFCAHAIVGDDDIMVIEDAHKDVRFRDNPLVTGDPRITFYAGVPLINEDGFALGTLCVIDSQIRRLNSRQINALKILGKQVTEKLEIRKKMHLLEKGNKNLFEMQDERTAAYKIIERNNIFVNTLIQQAPVSICVIRAADLTVVAVNDSYLELMGKERSQFQDKTIWESVPGAAKIYAPVMANVIATGIPFIANEHELMLVRKGKPEQVFVNFVYEPIKEADGKILFIMVVGTEVTGQVMAFKEVQQLNEEITAVNEELAASNEEIQASNEQLVASRELLTESEQRFRQMADNISQLAWMADANGYIYWYNRRWFDYTGTGLEEMKGWGWQKVHHPDYVDAVTNKIKKHFDRGEVWEDTFPLRDTRGDYQWFLSRAVPLKDENGQVVNWFGTNTEITEQIVARKQLEKAQKKLQESYTQLEQIEQKQTSAIEQAKLGTFSIDAGTGEMISSPRLKEIFGYLPDEEMPYDAAIVQISPEFQQEVKQTIEDSLTKGYDYNMEYSIIGHHDNKLRWVKATGKLYKSELDPAGHFSGTLLDITEQKEDDLRKNDFIGMVSHELKTPLTSLNSFVQVLQLRVGKQEDNTSKIMLEKAKRQINKMATLINGFLNVSRLESGKIHIEKQRFDMKDLVKEIEEETVPVNTTHYIIFHPVLTTWVNGDREKIGQVITNFINNALKYSAPGTTVQIACVAVDSCSQVSVRDEGMGIAAKDIDKLFDRYYRVEGHSMKGISGFGIGLYLCSEIIQRHHGSIWVESEPKKGATFFFSIPVID